MCASCSRSIEIDDQFTSERHLQFSRRGGSAGVELRTRKLKSPRFTYRSKHRSQSQIPTEFGPPAKEDSRYPHGASRPIAKSQIKQWS
jgi:hypothetical protein